MSVRAEFGLPSAREANGYWAAVHLKALELKSDGCSGASEVYREACLEHDIHYRTGKTLKGRIVTQKISDDIFWDRMVEMSPLRMASPMAWWRWIALRWFGSKAWNAHRNAEIIQG